MYLLPTLHLSNFLDFKRVPNFLTSKIEFTQKKLLAHCIQFTLLYEKRPEFLAFKRHKVRKAKKGQIKKISPQNNRVFNFLVNLKT